MIRVAIIDDNPESRKDLVNILGKEPDIRVVAEAEANLAGIKKGTQSPIGTSSIIQEAHSNLV